MLYTYRFDSHIIVILYQKAHVARRSQKISKFQKYQIWDFIAETRSLQVCCIYFSILALNDEI